MSAVSKVKAQLVEALYVLVATEPWSRQTVSRALDASITLAQWPLPRGVIGHGNRCSGVPRSVYTKFKFTCTMFNNKLVLCPRISQTTTNLE